MTEEAAQFLTVWLSVVTAAGGGLWAVVLYIAHKQEVERAQAAEREKLQETRRVEAQKPFLELQLKRYCDAVETTGKLVSEPRGGEAWQVAHRRFWALYWADLAMVENLNVETAMVEFGERLKQTPDGTDMSALAMASLKLAHTVRGAIESAWNAPSTQLDEKLNERRLALIKAG